MRLLSQFLLIDWRIDKIHFSFERAIESIKIHAINHLPRTGRGESKAGQL